MILQRILNFKASTLNYSNFQNILRLFDVLPNFYFTTSETMRDFDL